MGSIRSGPGWVGDGLTPTKAIKITETVMRAAERASEAALNNVRNRNGDTKANPLKVMDAAQRSFAAASKLQAQAEIEKQRLDHAASRMNTYLCNGDDMPASIDEALAIALNDGSIEDAVEGLLDQRGPMTCDQICDAFKGRFSQRRIEKQALPNLRKMRAIVGAALPGDPPVWASAERGIDLREVPGYTDASDKLALIRALYSQDLKRSEVAEKVGVTVEEINRWKYKEKIAVIWY